MAKCPKCRRNYMVDAEGEYCVECNPRQARPNKVEVATEAAASVVTDVKQVPAKPAPEVPPSRVTITFKEVPPKPETPKQTGAAKRASKKAEEEFMPLYYRIGDLDVIDILRTKLPREEYIGFLRGKIIACVLRAGFKTPGVEVIDYKKAHWYLENLVKFLEAEGGEESGGK